MSVATPGADAPVSGTRVTPASIDQIVRLAQYQFREYLRSRRFVILGGLVIMIGLIVTVVLAHFRGGLVASNLAFYGTFWGGGADLVIILAAVFFGGDAIAGEFQNKTGYFLMGLPIRRTTVYIGKFIAASVASVAMLLLYLLILVGNGAYYASSVSAFGSAFPWQLGLSLVLAVIYLEAVMGSTFLFSSLFKTSAYGFVLTAILFLFGFTLLQDLVQDLVNVQPWMVISYASSAVSGVFGTARTCSGTTISTVNWGVLGVYGIPGGKQVAACAASGGPAAFGADTPSWTAGIGEAVIIMLGYFVITAVVGYFLFDREEFS